MNVPVVVMLHKLQLLQLLLDFLRKISFEELVSSFWVGAWKFWGLGRFETFWKMGDLFLGIFGAGFSRYVQGLELVRGFWGDKQRAVEPHDGEAPLIEVEYSNCERQPIQNGF